MSSSAVRLLQAAADIVGGERELAHRLGIAETLLAKFMADVIQLPDALLLKAVDIVLAQRQSDLPLDIASVARNVGESPS